jgi:hypothetical protein
VGGIESYTSTFYRYLDKMQLKKYVKQCTWNEVCQKFIDIGYEGRYIRAFKRAFYELKRKPTIPSTSVINLYKNEIWAYYSHSKNEEEWMEMCGIPWGECLEMNVIVEKGAKMSSAEVVMHCLWSMTYFGFSEAQIEKKLTTNIM